ncbi:MAG: riboflavin kinase [Alistipes sp.]|nr:riboflavin kinase [Alistipes sp.]
MIIKGKVIRGAQLGRQMGFPTANIDARNIDIENGVYFSRVVVGKTTYTAMSNIGIRPSVDGTTRLLETHLFDFSGDLYGCDIAIEFIAFLRHETRFGSLDELKCALQNDAIEARKVLSRI